MFPTLRCYVKVTNPTTSPSSDHTSAWSQLWDEGESGLWDRGRPSPALVDILEHRWEMFGPMSEDRRHKTALVPV